MLKTDNSHLNSGKPRQKRLRQAISLLETGILKILTIKEERGIDTQTDTKTAYILNKVEKGMFSAVNALEERKSDVFRSELSQKIFEISMDDLSIHYSTLEQIQDFFQFVTDEKTGKMQRQIFVDLKRDDARIDTYLNIFSQFGVIFEDEKATFDKICQLCSWDSSLEHHIQGEIIEMIKRYKKQKSSSVTNLIQILQSQKHRD